MSGTLTGALLTKVAGLSVAGKAAVGVGIAAVAVGTVAAAPAVAQQFTGSAALPVPSVSASASATHAPNAHANPHATAHPGPSDLPSAAAFGQSVAADARDGGVDGRQISQQAHAKPGPTHSARP
ncbi:hypothetical protein [Cellulomonas sp. 73-145]|uniref:hypothetical protein n=1 Tax=Cellulomonas sp. 73-145 TaxID=1895739 RepID=UPI0025B856C6|nr:hypothetical protein [Cellulomonas sp. 73-145]